MSYKLYIGITISISSSPFTCVLFISVRQLLNGAEFPNTTFLLVLFTAAPWAAVFGSVMAPLASMYASL